MDAFAHTWCVCVCVRMQAHTRTLSHSVMSDSLLPHGLQPARLPCPWGFSRQEYCSGLPCPPPGDLANPGIKPRSPTLQVDSIPPGKLKTGVGSLSLLQGIFPIQELNQDLMHCRWTLYQLSYQGSPYTSCSATISFMTYIYNKASYTAISTFTTGFPIA